MMLGGGGGGGSRGRTLRERAGGALGGLVGVAGALTGQHRSIGGLTNAMVSGGATGSQLGSALGRKFVGRRGQARADLREAGKQADAERDAKMMEATRSRGQGMGSKFNPVAAVKRRNFAVSQEEDERARRATQRNEAVASTRAEQDKENQRMGRAFRQGMYRDAGRNMGQEARRYEEMGRGVEEFAPNFMAGVETFNRVNVPQEDSVDQRMQEMAQLPPAQKFIPPSKGAEDAGPNAEIVDIEDQAVSENDEILQQRLANMRPPEQDEEGEEEQQRPPFSQIRVRPPGQRSLFDKPE